MAMLGPKSEGVQVLEDCSCWKVLLDGVTMLQHAQRLCGRGNQLLPKHKALTSFYFFVGF